MIRRAEERDIPGLRDVERAAGLLFHEAGMAAVAEDEPAAAGTLLTYVADGRAWVYDSPAGVPVAYLLADPLDGAVHVEQVSVRPSHARRGIGAALIDRAGQWAARRGAPALTLTTFREVAWNGPYYTRLGFRWLADDELTPGLRAVRREEAAHGLDRWPRGCMRREPAV